MLKAKDKSKKIVKSTICGSTIGIQPVIFVRTKTYNLDLANILSRKT
jgi:hypothetical protein